jgi:hypothetical protein
VYKDQGVAPGWDDGAPLALEENPPRAGKGGWIFLSKRVINLQKDRAKGPLYPSLGQRPRKKATRKNRAESPFHTWGVALILIHKSTPAWSVDYDPFLI